MEKSFTVCGVKHEKVHLKYIFSAFRVSRIQNLHIITGRMWQKCYTLWTLPNLFNMTERGGYSNYCALVG